MTSYYCYACQHRFQASSGATACPRCQDEFIEEEDAGLSPSPTTQSLARLPPVSGGLPLPHGSPAAVIRITLPFSPSSSPEEGSPEGLSGVLHSILGIFSGNGRRRRSSQSSEVERSTRRRLSPPATTSPSTFAATFSTTLNEEDLASPDGLQRLLTTLFSQIADRMMPSAQEAPSDSLPTSENASAMPSTEERQQSPADVIRTMLQQVFAGPMPVQWIRLPAIPELLGDYVFGDRAFDDIISTLMEQAAGQRAPPRARQEDIDALERLSYLPGKPVAQLISLFYLLLSSLLGESMPADCSICREGFVENTPCIMLDCKHLFHEGCIVPWLQLNGTCPICRSTVGEPISAESTSTPATDQPEEEQSSPS